MWKEEYVGYLRAHPKGYSYSVITGYPTECGWVERNLGVDLDKEYAKDRLASVLDRLRLKNGHNPLRDLINGNLDTNLATYRRAVGSYRAFLDSQHGAEGQAAVPGKRGETLSPADEGQATDNMKCEDSAPAEPRTHWVPEANLSTEQQTVSELLALHAAILDELRRRRIVRSANGPGGDYAETLFERAFGWTRADNSTAGLDAIDWSGRRYQIKSRRLSAENSSRQLSALRRLPEQGFDYLAAVLFAPDYKILKAAMIPHAIVLERSKFREHTNSWTFFLDDDVWQLPDVRDVTAPLSRAAAALDGRSCINE